MFGISTLGWLHTLGSLPAIPAALYMFAKYGRIEPRTKPGAIYFVAMMIGVLTVFLVAKEPVGTIIGVVTLGVLIAGYSVERLSLFGRATVYLETVFLSLSVFLLMLPTVTEILTRVPDGHPIVTDHTDPLLVGAQGSLLLLLIVGLTFQIIRLRRARA